ncbi:Uncharacterised protein [Candidatus Gugararchaeum adminiculabundum]|nr:Uncharacterised protein [Candidatus Gugararchaeum adminiculabundum]
MKYLSEVREKFGSLPAFTISDLQVFLGTKKISKNYLYLLIHNLVKSGEIKKISRGVYTFLDESETVGFGFTPFYYGLQEALSLKNLWEQETNPIVLTPRKVRSGVRQFEGSNFVVRRIARKMFFGFTTMRYKDFWIPVSDNEKTLIDFAYFNEPLSNEALAGLRKNLDRKKLLEYLKRCPEITRRKVKKLAKLG